jgi:predicted amidohydrolase
MKTTRIAFLALSLAVFGIESRGQQARSSTDATTNAATGHKTVRIGAAQPKSRLIDWHVREPAEVLNKVDATLAELKNIVERAGAAGCDVVAFPEDTLGLGTWLAANEKLADQLLPKAVERLLRRLGEAAAKHRMYLVCCNDALEPDGVICNTAFFLGRDGREIGRYRKVIPVIHERSKKPGAEFPVFNTRDLGGVGMLICYDMVFPETARCLALGGADIIFHPTLGGAAIGDDEISLAAFRTRAVENFVYIVVAQRGSGSMIVSPQGKVLARAEERDGLAIADIDPFGGREGGDAMNHQQDMRARLFRERAPSAFSILIDTNPPVLKKVPAEISAEEAVRVANRTLTLGEVEFKAAAALASKGQTNEAIEAFERLRREYPKTWIDRVAQERLEKLRP